MLMTIVLGLSACSKEPNLACPTRDREWPLRSDLLRGIDPQTVRIHVDEKDRIAFNGEFVSQELITRYLRSANDLNPPPALLFEFSNRASCKQVEAVRMMLNSLSMCKKGYCAEHSEWERLYGAKVAPPAR